MIITPVKRPNMRPERIEIAVRSLRHGGKYFDVGNLLLDACPAIQLLAMGKDQSWKKLNASIVAISGDFIASIDTARNDYPLMLKDLRSTGMKLSGFVDKIAPLLPSIGQAISEMDFPEEIAGETQNMIDRASIGFNLCQARLKDRFDFVKGSLGLVEQSCNIGQLFRDDRIYVGGFVVESADVTVPNVNPQRLLETAENWINNARFHGNAKNVGVSVIGEGNWCKIKVEDDGTGLGPSLLKEGITPDRLKMQELNVSTRPAGEEGGLGEAISWYCALDHKGSIEIDSTMGEGAVKTLRIPIQQ